MITRIFFMLFVCAFLACSSNDGRKSTEILETAPQKIVWRELQQIIDSAHVSGAVLVFDPQSNMYYSNDFGWCNQGHLPASTFKIPNSIIALETGVVANDSTLFKWNGEKRSMAIWEQDLIFKDAFRLSCVPCYQDVARRIGVDRMNTYLKKLNYGHMVVDSTNIDLFWLEGKSTINQMEQIDFLTRLYNSQLPIQARTEQIIKRMMVIEENPKFKLSGKTGWSIRNGNNNGWFVGFLETKSKAYFFATNIEPEEAFNMDMFAKIRTEITMQALKGLQIID